MTQVATLTIAPSNEKHDGAVKSCTTDCTNGDTHRSWVDRRRLVRVASEVTNVGVGCGSGR